MNKLFSVILALALCFLLLSAAAEEASPVGTWYVVRAESSGFEMKIVDPEAFTLTISEDASFALAAEGMNITGTWTYGDSTNVLSMDMGEGEAQQNFQVRLEGDELIMDADNVFVFSRTPAEPITLSSAVQAGSIEDFNGTWKPIAKIQLGLWGPTTEDTLYLLIENGKVTTFKPGPDGDIYPFTDYDAEYEDGVLTTVRPEETMSFVLHEDGTLFNPCIYDNGYNRNVHTDIYIRME